VTGGVAAAGGAGTAGASVAGGAGGAVTAGGVEVVAGGVVVPGGVGVVTGGDAGTGAGVADGGTTGGAVPWSCAEAVTESASRPSAAAPAVLQIRIFKPIPPRRWPLRCRWPPGHSSTVEIVAAQTNHAPNYENDFRVAGSSDCRSGFFPKFRNVSPPLLSRIKFALQREILRSHSGKILVALQCSNFLPNRLTCAR
jgi:hypothetical protein